MKKLLDPDWLRPMQFKGNAGAKSVTPLDYDLLIDSGKFSKPKTTTKILKGNFQKSFVEFFSKS